jgi:uncharacterized protein YndB with AHSA1/START domain/uncharacterized protein YciI
MPPPNQQFFVRLIPPRNDWPESMTPDEQVAMGDHFEYLKKLTGAGKVLIAGPCFAPTFGLLVLETESENEAREIMQNDPSVLRKINTFEIQPMRVALLGGSPIPKRYVAEPSDKIMRKEVTVDTSLDNAWHAWTTSDGVNSFFARESEIKLAISGPYEIYFRLDSATGLRGSEDCRVLSFLPKQMLSFEWNAPPEFGELRNKRTQVILLFESIGPNQTQVIFSHLGWGKGDDWGKLYDYFDQAWSYVLDNFKKYFSIE